MEDKGGYNTREIQDRREENKLKLSNNTRQQQHLQFIKVTLQLEIKKTTSIELIRKGFYQKYSYLWVKISIW